MKSIFKIITTLCVMLLITSCNNQKSLQSYLVESQEKEGVFYGDIPVSSLISFNNEVSDDVKETMKSIKKINVAFLKKTADNQAIYEAEKNELKNILAQKDYKSLMTMKTKDMNIKVYYTGDTENIDEVIAFGYNSETGVGVARLLGENMNPSKIIEMLQTVSVNGEKVGKQFVGLF